MMDRMFIIGNYDRPSGADVSVELPLRPGSAALLHLDPEKVHEDVRQTLFRTSQILKSTPLHVIHLELENLLRRYPEGPSELIADSSWKKKLLQVAAAGHRLLERLPEENRDEVESYCLDVLHERARFLNSVSEEDLPAHREITVTVFGSRGDVDSARTEALAATGRTLRTRQEELGARYSYTSRRTHLPFSNQEIEVLMPPAVDGRPAVRKVGSKDPGPTQRK